MATKDNHNQERLSKQITLQYMKNLLGHLQDEPSMKQKENHSFVYLENDTLSTLLIYLISQIDNHHSHTPYKIDHFPTEELAELNNTLDDLLEKNQHEFEAFITLLKDKFNEFNDKNENS